MDIFIKRPVLAIVLSLVILLSGLLASLNLPVSQFPQIESSSLEITTEYVGVSADVVQGFVTEPIERIAMTIPGVDYVDSTTTAGRSKVTAWLKLNQNSTNALSELNTRLSQVDSELPEGVLKPVVNVVRVDRPGATFYLNAASIGMNRAALTDFLERQVSPQLSSIDGVQRVDISGGRKPAMRIWLDPLKMASVNIGANEVYNALNDNNVIASLGRTENSISDVSLVSNSIYKNAEDFKRLIIKKVDSSLVYLGDIARIEAGEDRGIDVARLDQSQTVFIAVVTSPGSNEITIGDQLYQQLAKINQNLPKGTEITIGFDGTLYMRDALKEIATTLVETIFLVGIVVVFLMGSFRTALVPLVTIPISILGSMAAMLLVGFSLNLLTILAVVLSVGLVVDDAIVVVENVSRHMRLGKNKIQAALDSSKELLGPIFAMTITLALVYVPIGFVSGLSGELFKEFAFTLAIAVIFSGIVALTLSPIMSAYVAPEKGKEGPFTQKINLFFEKLGAKYQSVLVVCFNHRNPMLVATVILSLLVVPFYMFAQKEVAPAEDQSSLYVISDAPPGTSLTYSNDYMRDTVNLIHQGEGVDVVWQVINSGNGFSGINFVPYNEREHKVQALLPEIYEALKQVTGLKVLPVLPMPLPTAGQFDVELVIQSQDSYENMMGYAYQLLEAASGTGKFMFVDTDLKMDMPQTRMNFDNKKMANLGLTPKQVIDQVSSMVSEQDVTRYNGDGKAYRVIPRVEEHSRLNGAALLDLQIKTQSGDFVPLSSIASIEHLVGARKMGKFNQQKAFRILGGAMPGTTPGEALTALEVAAKEILPQNYKIDYAGGSRQLRKGGNGLVAVLGVALFVVYLVLAVQFNSFRSPLVVLLGSVPLALSGAMTFAFLGMTSMNIYAQIGFITLVGLIAKNGILITEFANELQEQGMAKTDAIIQGAKTRLRPVLITTAATVLGHFPLLLVVGPGAEARNSIGIILVAGMLIGTVFTLLVLPCVYQLIAKDVNRKQVQAEAEVEALAAH